jgi:AcrR family transcriptional regulator
LSRRAIAAAALKLIRSEGNDKVTMRRLASELDTGAASLYAYFKDTDALYAAVLDEVLGALKLARGRKPWRERLIALLTSYVELLTGYPALGKTALFTRPSGPSSVGLWEAILALLEEGGIVGQDAAWAADFLLQRATATAAEEGERLRESSTPAADAQVEDVLNRVSRKDHPHLAALTAQMLSGSPATRLAWSLEVLLDGIAARSRAENQLRKASTAARKRGAIRPKSDWRRS